MILEYKASPPSHPAPDQRVHFLADSFKRPGQGPNIYMSSAAPAQKVSGASTIDEFNIGKAIRVLLLENFINDFRPKLKH